MRRRDFFRSAAVVGGAAALGCSAVEPRRETSLIVDAHCHAGRGSNYGNPDAAPWTTYNDPDRTLWMMKEAGIDKTIIFPISNTTYPRANEQIAGYVRTHPGKFIGFAKHDQKTEAGKIRELLTHEVRNFGLRGLKLHGAPTTEMMEVVAELKIPILCHPAKVADLEAVAVDWPEVNFILAHLGSFASRDWREHRAAIELARVQHNVWLETSSVVFFDYLEQAARELPAGKLIFGTDGPLVDPRVELHKIRLLRLPAESERKVLGGNILRLLPAG